MRSHRSVFAIIPLVWLLVSAIGVAFADSAAGAKPFLGRWDLTLKSAGKEYPSWLEVTMDGDQVKARMVARWGHARALPKVEVKDGHITFVSPKEEEDAKADLVFEGKRTGNILSGTLNGPDGATWQWTGRKAPELTENPSPKWEKPVQLFNGKDLTGWTMNAPNPTSPWTVKDGILVSPGHGPEIISNTKFKDFKLHIEFNRGENSNSGIYLRGRYEVQVETNSAQEPASHHTGGVYGFLDPTPELLRKAGDWESYDITLIGRTITVIQNGQTVIDHKEIPGITGGALDSHEELPGPIYLQGSEDGHTLYRNIVITPAK
jgi:hypothetical protein